MVLAKIQAQSYSSFLMLLFLSLFAAFFVDLGAVNWGVTLLAVLLIAITSTLLGLLIAVSAKQVFEAQTFSNFFRFPSCFLCGLFVPLSSLPVFVRPVSFLLPLTYGTDILNSAIVGTNFFAAIVCYVVLLAFAAGLFLVCLHNINRKWIL
jgi:ABC-2 type transport system permease protein